MIISGAYVGDKFSPLSDTTNLAAAVSNTGLFDHVRAMISTTGPTFVIALVLYAILGANVDASVYDPTVAEGIRAAIVENFNVSPLSYLSLSRALMCGLTAYPSATSLTFFTMV